MSTTALSATDRRLSANRTKGPDAVDAHVGARVRMVRVNRGLSQRDLAKPLGLTFQQVQKYEKGANRIGSGRLSRIAGLLGVEVSFFFEGAPGARPNGDAALSPDVIEMMGGQQFARMARAFGKIEDARTRTLIADLVCKIAGE
jgi:transcriptional regulator with XRE-family HTH domain